jgi:NAD(P)-dependent dehydrogenase (short-subunit alcohol dehydrogenase family)
VSPGPETGSATKAGSADSPIALVTGSSSGIGFAIAKELLLRGYRVALNGRDSAHLGEAMECLEADLRKRAIAITADISTPEGARMAFEVLSQEWPTLDLLVNNAGRIWVGEALEMTPDTLHSVMATTFEAALWCSQEAAKLMLSGTRASEGATTTKSAPRHEAAVSSAPQARGVIVNIGSIFARSAMAQRSAYVAAKHALLGLTRTLALEWGPKGIRVVMVSPAYVETEKAKHAELSGKLDLSSPRSKTPLGRLATPQEVARVVALVASKDASFVTGTNVEVDGGWMANGGW